MSYQKGITLIELVIAITIIGILASIAYPSYIDSVRKARRADAKSAMLELANYMEQTYTEQGKYKPTGFALPFSKSPTTGTAYYDLSLTTHTDNTYTLQAKPISTTDQNNDQCGTLTLSHTGETSGARSDCWSR